jgi:hypothetical protein
MGYTNMDFSAGGKIAEADSEATTYSGSAERQLKDLHYLFAFGCLGAFVLTAADGR